MVKKGTTGLHTLHALAYIKECKNMKIPQNKMYYLNTELRLFTSLLGNGYRLQNKLFPILKPYNHEAGTEQQTVTFSFCFT